MSFDTSSATEPSSRPGPLSRTPWIDGFPLRIALLGALVVLCVWSAWSAAWRAEWDSATYLLTATSMAAGDGYVYAEQPFFLRPPGLSWLLSFFLDDGIAPSLRAVHVLLGLFAAASSATLYCALLPHGKRFALAVTLLATTTPLMVERWNWVQSEFPFLALFFGGVALVERSWRVNSRWWLSAVLGAILLAGSYYVRSVSLMLLPGIVLLPALFHRKKRLRGVLPAVLFLGLVAPWMLHSKEVASAAASPPDQLLLFDYNTALLHTDPGQPKSPRVTWQTLRGRMGENIPKVAADVSSSVLFTAQPWARWTLGLLVLCGWLIALGRGPGLLEWFALCYAGLLALYFDHHERLSAPLTIFVLLYAAVAVRALANAALRKPRPRAAALAAVAGALLGTNAVALPYHLDLEAQPAESPSGELSTSVDRGELWERMTAMAGWLRENTAEDDVVLCHSAPIFRWLTGRRCYTYRFPRGRDLFGKYEPDLILWDGPPPQHLPNMALRFTKRQEWIEVGDWKTPVYWLKD